MHKAMEMLDFTKLPPSEDAIRAALEQLVQDKIFTKEEGSILLSHRKRNNPIQALLTFAKGPLAEK